MILDQESRSSMQSSAAKACLSVTEPFASRVADVDRCHFGYFLDSSFSCADLCKAMHSKSLSRGMVISSTTSLALHAPHWKVCLSLLLE